MALTNILNNAIKFTPERGTIKIRCVERPNEVWIQVKDNGVGIPQEDLTRIFEPFYQVEDHMTRRHGGMGLGLAIAKAVIEVHHGRIWVESPGTNQGSVFTISLPKAYPEDPEALKRITRH
jgi:two-component system sensor histidine kinase VicK